MTVNDEKRTPIRHAAPESLQGNRPFSEKSDVFMFGCSLWEMWTRRKPFDWLGDANKVQEERSKHKTDLAARFTAEWPVSFESSGLTLETLKQVKELILSCVQSKPEDRPSMVEVVQRLEQLIKPDQHPHPHLHLPSQPVNSSPNLVLPASSPSSSSSSVAAVESETKKPTSIVDDFPDLAAFLLSVKCDQYLKLLQEKGALLEDVLYFTLSDLEKYGIPEIAAKRLLRGLEKYK